jgi:UDP-glucose 4-epimerase
MKKKTVLITGIGGYIGSTIAKQLGSEYRIVGYGHEKNFSIVKKILGKDVKLIKGDIADVDVLKKVIKGVYAVIHTASPTTEKFCLESPWEAIHAIIRGTKAVRDSVVQNKIPVFVHFSTQAVYCNFKRRRTPFTEGLVLMPDTLYGSLKAQAEWELRHTPVIMVRPASVYGIGAGSVRENVVLLFARKIKQGENLVIYGNGSQSADFIHVFDLARLVEKILACPPKKKDLPLAVNAGAGTSVSVKEIASTVSRVAQENGLKKPKIIFNPSPTGRIAADRRLSIKRAKDMFGWKPTITFEEGVKELLS